MSTHCPSVPPLSVQFSPVWRVLSAILLLLLLLLTVWGKQQVLDQATTIRWSSTGTGTGRGRGSSSCSQVLLSVMKIACSRSERLRGGKRVSTVGQGGCGVVGYSHIQVTLLETGDVGAGSQMPFDRHKLPIGASCLNWRWANGKWEGVQGGEKREDEGGIRCCHATRSRTLLANRI